MNPNKRTMLKKAAGATAVSVAIATMPNRWVKPTLNSIVIPAHAQTSIINGPPVGQNLTVDALTDTSLIIETAPLISDPEGDSITITITGSGVSAATTFSLNAVLTGTQLTVSSTGVGSIGDGYVDYQLSDGLNTSPVYRITINNLAGS